MKPGGIEQHHEGPTPWPAAGRDEPFDSPGGDDERFVTFLARHWPRDAALEAARNRDVEQASTGSDAPVIGRFVISRELGRGGFATVYLARDPASERDVAVKVPHADAYRSADLRRRFEREGRAAASLDHPHINPVFETSQSAAEPYIASHYCAGPTLAEWLKRRLAPVSPHSAAELVALLAGALEHAHQRGILHRDLKPSNVLLDPADDSTHAGTFEGFVPRLADFGLAKIVEEIGDDDRTRTGVLLGTPRYMAPEQAIGDFERVTPRTDVYALGVMLYELLVGRPPFVGDTELETLRQVRSEEPVSIRRLQPNVPRALDTICLKCLEKEPARRYAAASELADDLRRFLAGTAIVARPKSLSRRVRSWTGRHPVQAIGLVSALAIAIGLPAGLAWHTIGLERAFRVAEHQRQRAQAFESQARANEQTALANAANVEQLVYASNMRLASELLKQGEFKAAAALVDRHDPQVTGGVDRRGFEWWYLRRLGETAKGTWQAHSGEVMLLAFSANGERLLTASARDGTARTWSATSGALVAEMDARISPALEVCGGALSPDGKLAASVVSVNTAAVWDAATGRIVARIVHTDRVRAITFSPDGTKLVTGGDDATRLWDVGQWEAAETILVPSRLAHFSSDGRVLALVGAAAFVSEIGFFDVKSRKLKRQQYGPLPIVDFAYSPDGRMMATLFDSPEGAIVGIDNPDTGVAVSAIRARDTQLRGVSFSADAGLLATAAQDGGLRFWKADSGIAAGGLRGAGGKISRFSFSPDGRWLATTSGGTVSLWDQQVVGDVAPLAVSSPATAPVAFHPRNNQVAVGSSARSILLVDPESAQVTLRLPTHLDQIADLSYSPDGERLASVDRRHLRAWSVEDGRQLWQSDAAGARCVAWSPDGETLATGGADRNIVVWDANKGTARATLAGHTDPLRTVRFLPDGKHLVALGGEYAVRVWDLATGKEAFKPTIPQLPTINLAVARDRSLVALLSFYGTVNLYDFSATEGLAHRGKALDWPKGFVPWMIDQPGNLLLSADGSLLGRAAVGDIFSVDDTTSGTQRYALGGQGIAPTSAALSPDGLALATVSRSGELAFWNTNTWRGRRVSGAPLPAVRGLAFAPDGRTLATACDNSPDRRQRGYADFPAAPNVRLPVESTSPAPGPRTRDFIPWQSTTDSLRLWNADTGAEEHPLGPRDTLSMLPSAAWSQTGSLLAAIARDGTLWAWDMVRGELLAERVLDERLDQAIQNAKTAAAPLVPQNVPALDGVRPLVAVSPDGQTAATLEPRGLVRLWNTATWQSIATLSDKATPGASLCFSPAGTLLAVTLGSQAQVYHVKTGELHSTFRTGDEPRLLCAAFSPDGRTLTLGTVNGNVQCYDVASRRLTATLVGHVDGVSSLSYSPDGRNLSSGSWDTTVRLWDVASGREVAVLEGHQGRVHAVAFSPDGNLLASGGETDNALGEVFLWRGRNPDASSVPVSDAALKQR